MSQGISDMSELGKIVEKLRIQRGLSQRELGRLANVTGSTISNIEAGKTKQPDVETLQSLARVLGVSDRTLFEPAGITPKNDHPTIPPELADIIDEVNEIHGTALYTQAMKTIREVLYLTILKSDPPPE